MRNAKTIIRVPLATNVTAVTMVAQQIEDEAELRMLAYEAKLAEQGEGRNPDRFTQEKEG